MKKRCCEACRRRHRRCITLSSQVNCNACIEAQSDCRYDESVRFKHHSATGADRFSSKVPAKLSFVTFPPANSPRRSRRKTQSREEQVNAHVWEAFDKPSPLHSRQQQQNTENSQPTASQNSRNTRGTVLAPQKDPQPPHRLEYTTELPPFASLDLLTPTPAKDSSPSLTQREAFLFKTYIHHLAPSSDACDEARHFGVTVPRLALREPVIMNGILALASRYDARRNESSDLESTHYHGLCIAQLRQALSRPPEQWDSGLLAAVVIARLYEEYDVETDAHRYHLTGTRNLLNHEVIYRFVMQGGLAEAASFVHLRQSIYVFLVAKSPVEINLASFEPSRVFIRLDDSSYANRMVYLLAKILLHFFSRDPPERTGSASVGTTWGALEEEVEEWLRSRPLAFSPIYYENSTSDSPFPKICMASDASAVGLQHYYAARTILCLAESNSANANTGYNAVRFRRETEKTIATHLGSLMALALSNESTINAFYLPCHMLSLCGYCITSTLAQDHTIRYLRKATSILQWKTSTLSMALQDQWADSTR